MGWAFLLEMTVQSGSIVVFEPRKGAAGLHGASESWRRSPGNDVCGRRRSDSNMFLLTINCRMEHLLQGFTRFDASSGSLRAINVPPGQQWRHSMRLRDALLKGPLGFGAAPLGNMFRNIPDEEADA